MSYSRAGRFGTKGLAITFQSSSSDQEVMAAIQSRFEVAIPELPDHIDPATYSTLLSTSSILQQLLTCFCSGVLGLILFSLRVITAVLVSLKVSVILLRVPIIDRNWAAWCNSVPFSAMISVPIAIWS